LANSQIFVPVPIFESLTIAVSHIIA